MLEALVSGATWEALKLFRELVDLAPGRTAPGVAIGGMPRKAPGGPAMQSARSGRPGLPAESGARQAGRRRPRDGGGSGEVSIRRLSPGSLPAGHWPTTTRSAASPPVRAISRFSRCR